MKYKDGIIGLEEFWRTFSDMTQVWTWCVKVRKHGSLFNFKQTYDKLRSMTNQGRIGEEKPQIRKIIYQTFENTEITGALSVRMKRMRMKWAILKCLEAIPTDWYNWFDVKGEGTRTFKITLR